MIDYTNSEDVKNELYDSFMDSLTSVEEYNFKLAIIADVNNYFHKLGYGGYAVRYIIKIIWK